MRYMTAGESHGKALVGIMDGVPAGIVMDYSFINNELMRRQSGQGRGARMSLESDQADILSGVKDGVTIGSPIAILIKNSDSTIDSKPPVTLIRPGHADYAGCVKFGFRDARNILERASARETAVRVSLGAVAKLFLRQLGVEITSKVINVGGEKTPESISKIIDSARKDGDTLGGAVSVKVSGCKAGIGSHIQYDLRLDYMLSGAIGAINAVKSVSIGRGADADRLKGTEFHDKMYLDGGKIVRKTNNAGGIEGGITNGEDIVFTAIMKPIPTTMAGLNTVDLAEKKEGISHKERSDVSAVEAMAVVAEAVAALELMKAVLIKTGGDYMEEVTARWNAL